MPAVKWNQCICHGYSENPGKEVRFTPASWTKLCDAAKRRQDHVYDALKPYIDGTVPLPLEPSRIAKHINCYKVYTLEKKRTACSPLEDILDGIASCSPQKRMTRSKVISIDLGKCIICQELYIQDKKDRRQKHEATPFTLPSAVDKLKQAAIIRNDSRIINHLAGGARGGTDAIAGDVLKHDICYHSYTCSYALGIISAKVPQASNASKYALHEIITMIQKSVVDEQAIWTMATVRSLFISALVRHGSYTKPSVRHLKDKLSNHFGDNLQFYRPRRYLNCMDDTTSCTRVCIERR